MAQIITSRWWGGWGGWASYTAWNWIDITNNEISVDTSVVQTTGNMVCDLAGADDSHYPTALAVANAISWWGGGDMMKSVYDPNNHNADAFDYCNFTNTPTIPTDNCQLANSCWYITNSALSWYAKTCDIPTDNCQLANWCGYTTCTWTLTSSNISNTSYGSSWSWVTTVAPSKNAVYAKVNSIDALIPSAATCSNQLADKDYVNDSINSVTAFYITKNAQGDQFACYAELAAATTFYSGWVQRTPTRNDYTIVADDECYNDATTRYLYNSGWEFQYCINESPMTTAQINAINSWITCTKVSCYDCCMAQCCDIPTDNCQLTNWCGYVTSAAIPTNNCQLANGCWYTTCTWTITWICMNWASCWTSWVVDLGTVSWDAKVFTISDLTSAASLSTATQAYTYAYTTGKNAIIRYSNANYVYAYGATTLAYFTRAYGKWAVSSGGWEEVSSLKLTVSSWSVTAIAQYTNLIAISSSAPSSSTTNSTITLVI